jgi:hypothetical protein
MSVKKSGGCPFPLAIPGAMMLRAYSAFPKYAYILIIMDASVFISLIFLPKTLNQDFPLFMKGQTTNNEQKTKNTIPAAIDNQLAFI